MSSKQVVIENVDPANVEQVIQDFYDDGAKDVKKEKQDNGKYKVIATY